MVTRTRRSPLALLAHGLLVVAGGLAFTLACFLVLPLIQAITQQPQPDTWIRDADTANLPPPPPPMVEEPEPEPESEPEPPALAEDLAPLDLSQLELALDPGFGAGFGGDFAVQLDAIAGAAGGDDAIFSMAELDQKPRVLYQPGPTLDAKLRRLAPGTAYVIFVVDEEGRVRDAKIQSSTDPAFERPSLKAVKTWKFEPGKRGGKPVRFRMRIPITYPKA